MNLCAAVWCGEFFFSHSLHLDSDESANLCMQSRNISKKFDLINSFIQTNKYTYKCPSAMYKRCSLVWYLGLCGSSIQMSTLAIKTTKTEQKYEGNDGWCWMCYFFYHHKHLRFLSPLEIKTTSRTHTQIYLTQSNLLEQFKHLQSNRKAKYFIFCFFFLVFFFFSLSVCLGKYSVL